MAAYLDKSIAREILERLSQYVLHALKRAPCVACGAVAVSDKELELARKLLADNDVRGVVMGPEALVDLADDLPFKDPDEPVTVRDRETA